MRGRFVASASTLRACPAAYPPAVFGAVSWRNRHRRRRGWRCPLGASPDPPVVFVHRVRPAALKAAATVLGVTRVRAMIGQDGRCRIPVLASDVSAVDAAQSAPEAVRFAAFERVSSAQEPQWTLRAHLPRLCLLLTVGAGLDEVEVWPVATGCPVAVPIGHVTGQPAPLFARTQRAVTGHARR